jgi:hypothetical protein
MSRRGIKQCVEQCDVKEHGEETTRSGFAKRKRHVAVSVTDFQTHRLSQQIEPRRMHDQFATSKLLLQCGESPLQLKSRRMAGRLAPRRNKVLYIKSEALGRSGACLDNQILTETRTLAE